MLRSYIVRIYWDDSPYPSVEAPLGDLFGVAHGRTASFMTPYVGMPEGRSFHCDLPDAIRKVLPHHVRERLAQAYGVDILPG